MQIKKEFKIGLLVVVSIFLLFFGVNFLKGINIFSPTNIYKVEFERIDGLAKADAVTAKGFKIGRVHSISYDFSRSPAFVVEITVSDGLKLPLGIEASLYNADIAGTKAIEIKFPETQATAFYKPGDVIPSTIAPGMIDKASELLPAIGNITVQLDSLLQEMRGLVNDPAVKLSLGSMERSMANLESTLVGVNKMVNNQMPQLLARTENTVANFEEISGNLKEIDLQQSVNSLNGTMDNLLLLSNKLNSNEGTLGLLLNDNALYSNMTNTMNSADRLLIDLRQNPKRYVHFSLFGRSDK